MEAVDLLREQNRTLQDDLKEKNKKVDELEKDNAKQRDEIRALKTDKETLEAQVPADGSLVLSKADAQRWELAKEVSEQVGGFDKLKSLQSERDEAKQSLTAVKQDRLLETHDFIPAKVRRVVGENAVFGEAGDDEKHLTLTVKDGDEEKTVSLTEWAEAEDVADLLAAARKTDAQPKPEGVKILPQAGARQTRQHGTSAEQIYEQKKSDPRYKI